MNRIVPIFRTPAAIVKTAESQWLDQKLVLSRLRRLHRRVRSETERFGLTRDRPGQPAKMFSPAHDNDVAIFYSIA
jgi:hypothetical protein